MEQFTKALKANIENNNLYGALFIALSLPDICGSIEFPQLQSTARTIEWFDKYLANYFKGNGFESVLERFPLDPEWEEEKRKIAEAEGKVYISRVDRIMAMPEHLRKGIFMNGRDFYSLRCAYLHQGLDDISSHKKPANILDRFIFMFSSNSYRHLNKSGSVLELDVITFCNHVVDAVDIWLLDISDDNIKNDKINKMAKIYII